jgi:hypothetical protein
MKAHLSSNAYFREDRHENLVTKNSESFECYQDSLDAVSCLLISAALVFQPKTSAPLFLRTLLMLSFQDTAAVPLFGA